MRVRLAVRIACPPALFQVALGDIKQGLMATVAWGRGWGSRDQVETVNNSGVH